MSFVASTPHKIQFISVSFFSITRSVSIIVLETNNNNGGGSSNGNRLRYNLLVNTHNKPPQWASFSGIGILFQSFTVVCYSIFSLIKSEKKRRIFPDLCVSKKPTCDVNATKPLWPPPFAHCLVFIRRYIII